MQLKLNNKKHTLRGIISTCIAGVLWVLIIVLVLLTILMAPSNALLLTVGIFGLIGLLGSLVSLVIGILSFFESETRRLFSYIGTALSGGLIILLVFFYFIGVTA